MTDLASQAPLPPQIPRREVAERTQEVVPKMSCHEEELEELRANEPALYDWQASEYVHHSSRAQCGIWAYLAAMDSTDRSFGDAAFLD